MTRKHAQGADGSPAGVSRPDPVAAKAAAIKAGQAQPPTWQTVIKRLAVLAIAGTAIYLVLPSLLAVLGSCPRLSALRPAWFAAELASFTCNFAVQRLALRTRGWSAAATTRQRPGPRVIKGQTPGSLSRSRLLRSACSGRLRDAGSSSVACCQKSPVSGDIGPCLSCGQRRSVDTGPSRGDGR